jgi:lysozyme
MARLIVAIGAGLLSFMAWRLLRQPTGTTTTGEDEAIQETDDAATVWQIENYFSENLPMTATPDPDVAESNMRAFLWMIRTAEGTAGANGYRTMFGGRLFDSYADHPRQAKQFTNGAGQKLWTSAAGAYQFMAISPIPGGSTRVNTWDRLQSRLGLSDFSPESQDAAAVELIREAGALGDVRAGRFDEAVTKVRNIWASLPGAGYAQPEKSLESLRLAFLNAGGSLA